MSVYEAQAWPHARGGRRPAPNPYIEHVERSFDTDTLLADDVPTADVGKVSSRIRTAAKELGVGVAIQVQHNEDGTSSVFFKGQPKRGSKNNGDAA